MRRLLVAVAVLLTGLAVPQTSAAPACFPGSHVLRVGQRVSCVHADHYDAYAQQPWLHSTPVTAAPTCYGDGRSGPRVQLIYGYVAGQPNRARTMVPMIRGKLAPRMEAVVRAASAGRDLSIRFAYDAGCRALSVPVIRFPASVARSHDPNAQLTGMIGYLRQLGYSATDRKYQVIWDWWNGDSVCGLGELINSDTPGPLSPDDGSDLPVYANPQYSAVWRTAYAPRGPDCFELDQSRAGGEIHELFHTLGAVQESAPHSDGGGHCTDTPSVMCAVRGGRPAVASCARQRVQVLDCGNDDFWNPSPVLGSYLSTHRNIATSTYFGPQPQDSLPAG